MPDGYAVVGEKPRACGRPLPRGRPRCGPATAIRCAENFLDTGTRMWMVDWEYAGKTTRSGTWATSRSRRASAPEQDAALLQAYFAGGPPAAQVGRMVIYKAMCDLLWTLWGVIQEANENPVDDFWAYAINRFERCKALMAAPSSAVISTRCGGAEASYATGYGPSSNGAAW